MRSGILYRRACGNQTIHVYDHFVAKPLPTTSYPYPACATIAVKVGGRE